MNCSEVLLEIDMVVDRANSVNQAVQGHLDSCESCSLVWSDQLSLKRRLKEFIADIETPADLTEHVLRTVRADSKLGMFLENSDGSIGASVAQELLREDIIEVMKGLSPRERDVLRLRFGLDDGQTKTLEEVATLFGTTREKIRTIEAHALRLLRHPNRSRRSYCPPPDDAL